MRVNYIQMPLQMRALISDYVSIGAGPQMVLKTWIFEDGYRNLVFSGVASVQIRITDLFFVDARYILGFSNKFDDETGLDAVNTNFQVGVGVRVF